MRATEKRKTVLLVSDGVHDLTGLKAILEKNFRVFYLEKGDNDFAGNMEKSGGQLGAAIVCASDVAQNDYALFNWLSEDTNRSGVPMLVYFDGDEELAYAEECIKRGAIDVLCPPIYEEVVMNRVSNAIRLKESATIADVERWLEVLPSNIYLKDEKGRYVFVTNYWEQVEGSDDPDWTIRGKTDLEIRSDKENARIAMETDAKILKTGKGVRYIIEENATGTSKYFELIKEPVRNEKDEIKGIIALINDVTEMMELRRRVEESSQRDDLTGVRNKKGYDAEMERIEKMIESKDAEFALAVVDMNHLKTINDTYGHDKGDIAIRRLSHLICFIFTHSSVFRIGGDEFVVLLEKEDYHSYSFLEKAFMKQMKKYTSNKTLSPWEQISAAIGVAFYDPDTDKSHQDVFERADQAMYVCKKTMHEGRE